MKENLDFLWQVVRVQGSAKYMFCGAEDAQGELEGEGVYNVVLHAAKGQGSALP